MLLLGTHSVMFLFAILLWAISARNGESRVTHENGVNSIVYLSPKITTHPGSVSDKYYYDIEFPKGHIAIKSFNSELVDDAGNAVSLQETYLHHLFVSRYYQRIGTNYPEDNGNLRFHQSDIIIAGNSGICDKVLNQFFGSGAETRKTSTHVPDPYGIQVGNPLEVPAGYEEKWFFNIHAVDTRNVEDPMGCLECRCNLYNVTEDEHGQPLNPNYVGGLHCCYDGTHCKSKKGLESAKRDVYLKYTIKWIDWSDSIVPVKIFIFDVTDPWEHTGIHDCAIEYDIEESTTNDFTSTRRSSVASPTGGDVIYSVAHLHIGGKGSALYGKDGRIICSSNPIYGEGSSVGDESGYVVGMSTCYPKPGSVKIAKGETLTFESNYSSETSRSAVMGFLYLLVAEPSLELNDPVQVRGKQSEDMFQPIEDLYKPTMRS